MKRILTIAVALAGLAVLAGRALAAPPSVEFLSPAPGSLLAAPAATVSLRFPENSRVQLWVNNAPISDAQVGRSETDHQTHQTTRTWYGVGLRHGANALSALATLDGVDGLPAMEQVLVSDEPQTLTLTPQAKRLPADGRSTITIVGQLRDQAGHDAGMEGMVVLETDGGKWVGKNADPDQPGFHVLLSHGRFAAILQSGNHAQIVHVHAMAGAMRAETQIEFTTSLRPGIVAGVVDLRFGKRSLDFNRPVQDFLQTDPGHSESPSLRVSSSGFATGAVDGALVSGAFNSDHALNQTFGGQPSLGRDTQIRDQQYVVYGDSSESEALAQSRDHGYLRVELDRNYALWGDYGTAEFAGRSQQLSALTRQFHAFKANYNVGSLQATGFYGNDVQGFQRDTLVPDGTGGFYFLSHRPLVYGSENVVVELDDLTRPGIPLQATSMSRGVDYEIDYDRGTLLFHQPLLSTDVGPDGRVLARHVVVTYQYQTGDRGTDVYGARLQWHLPGGGPSAPGLFGTTLIRQNQGLRSFTLSGADALLPLGPHGQIVAEFARSDNGSELLGQVKGTASRIEAEGQIGKGVQARAYWRSVSTGFANDATVSFVPGQTRSGAQVTAAVGPATHLRAQIDHETDTGTPPLPTTNFSDLIDPGAAPLPGIKVDNSLTTVSAGVEQRIGPAELSVDLIDRHRVDHAQPVAAVDDSRQIEARLAVLLAARLSLQAQTDVTVSSQADAVETDRTLIGLRYAVAPGVDLRLSRQFFGRGQYSGRSITSLDAIILRPWGEGDLSERFSIAGGANGVTIQQALGLGRRWTLAPGLRLNAAYERISGSFLGRTQAGPQFEQPYAPGQSAASLGFNGAQSESLGLEYTRPSDFRASARLENRTSSGGRNLVITAAAAGKLSPALTSLFTYQQADAANALLSSLGQSTTVRLGLAYRDPASDRWNALMRYEYRRNPSTTPDSLLLGSGTGSREQVFAIEAVYAPEWQWEFYGKLALRDSATYLAQDFTGSSRLTLAQARAVYRWRENLDLLAEARWISEPAAGYRNEGARLEAGFYLSPDMRLGLGYNFGRLDDPDFNGSQWSGGFSLGLTAKVDQLFSGFGVQRDAFDPPAAKAASKASAPVRRADADTHGNSEQ